MCALSIGRCLAYVFGAGSNLAELRISGVSEIKHVDQKKCPVGNQKDKIKNPYVLILQSSSLLSWSPSHTLHWT